MVSFTLSRRRKSFRNIKSTRIYHACTDLDKCFVSRFAILSILNDSVTLGSRPNGTDADGLKTSVACQGQHLRIGCGDGLRLEVVRANFGRFSIAVCNPAGDTHYAVNCQSSSKATLKTLLDRYCTK